MAGDGGETELRPADLPESSCDRAGNSLAKTSGSKSGRQTRFLSWTMKKAFSLEDGASRPTL